MGSERVCVHECIQFVVVCVCVCVCVCVYQSSQCVYERSMLCVTHVSAVCAKRQYQTVQNKT